MVNRLVDVVLEDTDIGKIYKSGQCFEISQNPFNVDEYWCVSGSRFCRVVYEGEVRSLLTCFEVDKGYWLNYFDMETDYSLIAERYIWGDESELSKYIVSVSKGLRMLNQDFPDCLVSFITSQRKSVSAIRTAIDGFCRVYGKCYRLEEYFGSQYEGFEIYTFPSKDRYGSVSMEGLENLGFGYRSPYVVSALKEISEGNIDGGELKKLGYSGAKSNLMRLYGVGEKIANCVLLYSLGYKEAYPRDIWIKRFEEEYCNGRFPVEKYRGIAGIIQLWQYYFMLNGR